MALILDTGPFDAGLDRSDAERESCRASIETTTEVLVIPAPVLVEVDDWIHRRSQPGALVALVADIELDRRHFSVMRPRHVAALDLLQA